MSYVSLVDALKEAPEALTASDRSKMRHSLGLINANGVHAGISNLYSVAGRHRVGAQLASDPERRRQLERAADHVAGIIAVLEMGQ